MQNMLAKGQDFGCDMNFEPLLKAYFEEELSGRSALTIRARLTDLKKFVAHYQATNGHQKILEWRPLDTRRFMDALLKQGYQATTVNRHLASVRAFGR